jgi:outer membrane protein TolC
MLRLFVTTVLVSVFAFGSGYSQVITLDEYIDRVRTSHPFFEKEAISTDIQKKERDGLLGAEDWRLISSPSFTHREPLQQSPFDPERIDFLTLNAGVGRTFWSNGSRLFLSWSSDVTDQKIPGFSVPGPTGPIDIPIGPSTYYRHAVSATYSLPLLKNRHGTLDRLQYELSRFDVDLSAVTVLENQEDFLLELSIRFLSWTLLDEQLHIAGDRLALAQEELDRSRRKRDANLIDEVDVRRAEDAVYVAQGAVYLIESSWKAVQAELATLAGSEEIYLMTPQFDLYERPQLGSPESAMENLEHRSRLIRSLRIQRTQLGSVEAGLAEAARPELALNLIGSLSGGDEEFGGSLEVTQPDVTIGVEFRYPFGNRTATAEIEKTRLQTRQLSKAIEEVEITLEAGLRNVLVQANELTVVLNNNVAQIETAKQRTEEEIRLYNQGRGDLTFVIQSRDREASSKLSYAENSALYHNLVLRYRALTDDLLK